MKLVNLYGSNAAGKSTRVTAFVKYLEEVKNIEPQDVFLPCSDGVVRKVGSIYDNIFVIGSKSTRGKYVGKWVGLDRHHFMRRDHLLNLYKTISTDYPVDIFIQEGFFMNDTPWYTLDRMLEYGITSYEYYFFIHETVEVFMERCNNRSSRQRTLEEIENSAGWKSCAKYKRIMQTYLDANDEGCLVKELDPDCDLNFLAIRLYDEDPGFSLQDVEVWFPKPTDTSEW